MRSIFEKLMNKEPLKTTGASIVANAVSNKGINSFVTKPVAPSLLVETVDTFSGVFNRSGKLYRLECPHFDGGDFSGWIMKLEQFFKAKRIKDEAKVRLVMMQLEGRALQWHQHYAKTNGGLSALSWLSYLDDMRKRFADTKFSDPMSNLVALKQHSSIDDYYDAFLSLLNSLQLSPEYALSIFISNLRLEISNTVRLFFPKTLSHAFNLARQLETLNYISFKRPFIPYKNPPQAPPIGHISSTSPIKPSTLPLLLPTSNIPMLPAPQNNVKPYIFSNQKVLMTNKNIKIPTRQERDERRKNGLYMWCGIKFTRGYQCLKSQLYHMLLETDHDSDEDNDLFLDCEEPLGVAGVVPKEDDRLVISLHALIGTVGYNTIRVQGKIKNQLVSILVDTGSTHNFANQRVTK